MKKRFIEIQARRKIAQSRKNCTVHICTDTQTVACTRVEIQDTVDGPIIQWAIGCRYADFHGETIFN